MVLEDALMELMEDIRGDAREDVAVGKIQPEGLVDRAQPLFVEFWWVESIPMLGKGLQCSIDIAWCTGSCSSLRGKHRTAGAIAFADVDHETLLRMVGNIGSQKRKDATRVSISA